VTARLLGAAVGGLIVLTNTRTLFGVGEASASVRWPVYLSILAAWAAGVAWVVRAHRQNGEPLFVRRDAVPSPATSEAAT
jgi:uncharacterized protein